MAINWAISEFDSVPSTQDTLKEMIVSTPDLPEGTLIHAVNQSNGYGRHARVWEEGEGNLYFSFLVKPNCKIDEIGQLSLLIGLALSIAIDKYISVKSTLKWANDVLIKDKKACGILIEALSEGRYIIGVGVNIKSAPLDISTCLEDHSDQETTAKDFLSEFLSCFSVTYHDWQANGFDGIREAWLDKSFAKGAKVNVKLGAQYIEGEFESIDMQGNLLLMCDGKVKMITSGEVFLQI